MKDLLLHNWHLKALSLVLATVLWSQVARTPTSEIGVLVPLIYQNIPPRSEVVGDISDRVEVRLRGSSWQLRTLTAQEISVSLDVQGMSMGQERIVPLTPELVLAPLGTQVVRVIPGRVRLAVEPTITKVVRIEPIRSGIPGIGYAIEKIVASPATVEVEGPESHILSLETVPTTEIDVGGKQVTFTDSVELDIPDPLVRVQRPAPVTVEVQMRPQDQ